jgi:hypothetical protein
MADITLKRGDLGRPIVRRLWEKIVQETVDATTGVITQTITYQPINLTGATSVRLVLKDTTGNTSGGGTATVTNATQGEVTYTTVATDLSVVRLWNMEYEITWSATNIETVPNEPPAGHADPYYQVQVVPDLGGSS